MNPFRPLLTIILISIFHTSHAQSKTLYNYQELSHLYYAKQKDSLKKAWPCPVVYKDKATQKKYKEIWDERTDFITEAITEDNYVHENDVVNYIQGIVDQLVQGNPQMIPVKPLVLIDRDPSVNAYSIGGNVIAVNLGLIAFAQSREDLALVIAHELSHNILNHRETAMRQQAEWFTSDDYKKSMNAVLDSKYERLSRLNKVLEGFTFSRSRHQRYKESDADSLAVILLKKSNIPFSASFYLRLDSSDIQYRKPLKTPVKNYLVSYQLPFDDAWTKKRSKGLSTRNYNFKDTTSIDDSLKTHPDCVNRYAKTLAWSTPNAKQSPLPAIIRDKATKMLIWNLYDNMSLTHCLYRIFLEKDKGNTDEWYDFMVNNIFASLYYADRELHRFNAIGVTPKEYISKDYFDLQTLFEQIPRESLEAYCKTFQNENFWKDMSPAEKALKTLMYTLALDPDDSEKNKARAAKEFTANNASSMYCEFADAFQKK
jgi:hypothetical protein